MTALWVILGILAFFALLLLLRVGVRAQYSDQGLFLWARAGRLHIQVYPVKKKKRRKEKGKEGKAKKKKGKEPETEESKKGGNVSFFISIIRDILDVLGRFRKRIKIDELTVWYMSASEDPSSAAICFGAASAGMGLVTGILENNFKIKKRDFRTAVNFEEKEPWVYVKAEFSLAVWEILYIILKPGYNILKKYQMSKASR